ncbi:MAG: hypothetical protein AABX08_02085 [Nanoarchaeota archaeon]
MIELGGNIKLINFEAIEPALLIVVKKIVGNYTKKISETIKDFKSIEVSLENKEKNKIKVKIEASETKEFEAEDKNLFFALDKALGAALKG